MMKGFRHTNLSDLVQAAVACLGDARKVYVLVHELHRDRHGTEAIPRAPTRILLTRLYAGEHKQLDHRRSVLVGYDLSAEHPLKVARCSSRSPELLVEALSAPPVEGLDHPFEGTFDLRKVEIPAAR